MHIFSFSLFVDGIIAFQPLLWDSAKKLHLVILTYQFDQILGVHVLPSVARMYRLRNTASSLSQHERREMEGNESPAT
jgi:hypothetical protein